MTAVYGIGILLIFLALAVPVGFALGLTGMAGLSLIVPTDLILSLMGKVAHETAADYVFLAVPLFILMAEFLSSGRVAEDMLLACNRALRRVKGGLAIACVLAGVVHAACTGSSGASAASLARASFPAMMRAGYAPSFATGIISIAGTLAILIPPSVAFILYGLMTNTSIGKLFLAGVIPGLLTAVGYAITILIVLSIWPHLGPKKADEASPEASVDEKPHGSVWPMLLLVLGLLVALYGGIATPTEIAAIGAAAALAISFFTGHMNKKSFVDAIGSTLRITTMVTVIIFSAHLFGYFLTMSKVTEGLLLWITNSGLPGGAVVSIITFIYIVLGTFMDQAAIIILTAPVSTPLVVGLGYDPVWWGVIMTKTAEVGLVSPPLGLVVFIVANITKVDVRTVFIGVLPFIVTEFIIISLMLMFPDLVMWLPNLAYG